VYLYAQGGKGGEGISADGGEGGLTAGLVLQDVCEEEGGVRLWQLKELVYGVRIYDMDIVSGAEQRMMNKWRKSEVHGTIYKLPQRLK
jgi:hypothetical protein